MIDTNILGRLADVDSLQHAEVRTAVAQLHQQHHLLYFTPQIKREFLGIAERPKGSGAENNGLGLSKSKSISVLNSFKRNMKYLTEKTESDRWFDILYNRFGGGRKVHDLYITASMLAYDIKTILTYNEKDFADVRDAGYIDILIPPAVLQDHTEQL